ncbi:NADH-ubiquinone oxidoreductase-F iron-sulfur binding region domain-containing protein [soil metagenome]
MALDERKGVWKSGRGKGRGTPKGRQLDDTALDAVRALLGARERRRDHLIEFLHLIQDRYGHLSAGHLHALAEEMRLAQAEVYEVATFYHHFDVVKEGEAPPPALTIRVCDSLSCEMAGADALAAALAGGLDPAEVRVLRAPCMGRCDTAPVAAVGRNHVDHATPGTVTAAVKAGETGPRIPDYEPLEAYRAGGGYAALSALRAGAKSPDEVRREVLVSGLRGLGGAGFPSGKKFSFVAEAPAPRYLAVNGDEGEPGTFKDRWCLERTLGAARCFVYMRDEYPAVLAILAREIAALEAAGIVEPGDVELRRGADAYICGEESAMIESIEGKRGLPRHRPPYVAEVGIFGRPTLVHNVETLHWIARVCREGPEVLSAHERNGRRGLRAYSVSGRVKAPGVHVLPAGSTIRDVIAAAGGMAEGHAFKAYQPGGPSSGLLPAALDDVPLDFDTLQPHGSFIGSAAVVVLSDRDSMRDAARNMLAFFAHESCGQCTPCRVGCAKAVELMGAERWDRALLAELCDAMADASICGLGQAAPNPIRLTMAHFPDEI